MIRALPLFLITETFLYAVYAHIWHMHCTVLHLKENKYILHLKGKIDLLQASKLVLLASKQYTMIIIK